MNTGVYIIHKLDAPEHPTVLAVLQDIKNAVTLLKWKVHKEINENTTLLLAIGGDGTMMHGMRLSAQYNIPVLGFNIGKLGFLSEYSPNTVLETLSLAKHDALKKETRTILECVLNDIPSYAVNEFVFSAKYADKMLKYEFDINGIFSGKHLASGVIIATPTGSTAYALSSGGSVLEPSVPALEIIPVSSVSLNARGVIVADSSVITISVYPAPNIEYLITADGQRVHTYSAHSEKSLTFQVKKATQSATLLHHPNWNFFTTLSNKLKWNNVN